MIALRRGAALRREKVMIEGRVQGMQYFPQTPADQVILDQADTDIAEFYGLPDGAAYRELLPEEREALQQAHQ